MTLYGQNFMEFLIASIYFKSKAAKSFGFFSFVKQMAYKIAMAFGSSPNWVYAHQR